MLAVSLLKPVLFGDAQCRSATVTKSIVLKVNQELIEENHSKCQHHIGTQKKDRDGKKYESS